MNLDRRYCLREALGPDHLAHNLLAKSNACDAWRLGDYIWFRSSVEERKWVVYRLLAGGFCVYVDLYAMAWPLPLPDLVRATVEGALGEDFDWEQLAEPILETPMEHGRTGRCPHCGAPYERSD